MQVVGTFKRGVRFIFLLLPILSGLCTSVFAEGIKVHLPQQTSDLPQNLQDFYSEVDNEGKPVHGFPLEQKYYRDLELDPEKIKRLAQKLLIGKDPPGTIHIVITGSLVPHAGVHPLKKGDIRKNLVRGGDRVISISLGMLRILRNDSQFAWLTGHELSHSTSQLQKKINESNGNKWQKAGEHRTVENEADIESAIRRVRQAGLNPFEGPGFLRVLRENFGNTFSRAHTITSSRIDSADLVLVLMNRVQGAGISKDPNDYPPSEIITPKLIDKLNGNDFKQQQIARIRKMFNDLPVPVEYYEEGLRGEKWRRTGYGSYFDGIHKQWSARVEDFTFGIVSKDERLELELELMTRLQQNFDEARGSAIAKLTEPLTNKQIIELRTEAKSRIGAYFQKFPDQKQLSRFNPRLRESRKPLIESLQSIDSNDIVRMEEAAKQFDTIDEALGLLRTHPLNDERILAAQYQARLPYANRLRPILQETLTTAMKQANTPERAREVWKRISEVFGLGRDLGGDEFNFLHSVDNPNRGTLDAPPKVEVLTNPRDGKWILNLMDAYVKKAGSLTMREHNEVLTALETCKIRCDASYHKGITQLVNRIGFETPDLRSLVAIMGLHGAHYQIVRLTDRGEGEVAREVALRLADRFQKLHGVTLTEADPKVLAELFLNSEDAFEKLRNVVPEVIPEGQKFFDELVILALSKADSKKTLFTHDLLKFRPSKESRVRLFELIHAHPRKFYIEGELEKAYVAWAKAQPHGLDRNFFKSLHTNNHEGYRYAQQEMKTGLEALNLNQSVSELRKSLQDLSAQHSRIPHVVRTTAILKTIFDKHHELGSCIRCLYAAEPLWRDAILTEPDHNPDHWEARHILYQKFRILTYNADRKPKDIQKLTPKERFMAFMLLTEYEKPSEYSDLYFESLWKNGEPEAEISQRLQDPRLTRRLKFDPNKKKLVIWQVERKWALSTSDPPQIHEVRKETTDIVRYVNASLPEASAVKNEIFDELEDRLLTSSAENDLFRPHRFDAENWTETRGLAILDIAHLVHAPEKITPNEQLARLKYILGLAHDGRGGPPIPSVLRSGESGGYGAGFLSGGPIDYEQSTEGMYSRYLSRARHELQAAHPLLRTFMFQSLFSGGAPIDSDAAAFGELKKLILGDYSTNKFIVALFDAYVEGLDAGERNVVMSYILSRMMDHPSRKPSLKEILLSMGPMGVRAAQILLATGLGGAKLQAELEGVFDEAMPPNRTEIYDKLKQIFGENLIGMHSLGRRMGSGTVNYVVAATIRLPNGTTRRVVVRIQRDGVENMAEHENANWERTITILKRSGDQDIKDLAAGLEEVARKAHEPLKPGGADVVASHERMLYDRAQQAYGNKTINIRGRTLRVEAVKPDLEGQNLVRSDLQDRVSVYEFVDFVPLEELDANTRRELSERIMEMELENAFRHGIFDPDGHRGNWLYSPSQGRLVRVDYAQLTQIPPAELERLRSVFAILVEPMPNRQRFNLAVRNLLRMFTIHGASVNGSLEGELRKILKSRKMPPVDRLDLRILFLKEQLQESIREHSPTARVTLSEHGGDLFSSLTKLNSFRKYVPGTFMGERFIETVHPDPKSVKRKIWFRELAIRAKDCIWPLKKIADE